MRVRNLLAISTVSILLISNVGTATADSAKPGQSMTHIKTAAGVASTLEAAGVILYVQGGATSALIGENLSAETSQVVFHIPVTANKAGVQHVGSNIIFFNTANNLYLNLKNPVIDLAKGVVSATVPLAGNMKVDILTITNASTAKPKITNDKKTKQRTTVYRGTTLVLAPGIAAVISTGLGLPAGSLPDGMTFGTADVTLYSNLKQGTKIEPITRRSLFAGACAVLALGDAEVPAAANPAVKKLSGGRLSVDLKAVPALAKVGGAIRIGTLRGVPVAIARTGTSKYMAFSLKCPHQGVTVTRNENGWVCSAHLSEFEPDGDLVLGPATTGLARVPIKVSRGIATLG